MRENCIYSDNGGLAVATQPLYPLNKFINKPLKEFLLVLPKYNSYYYIEEPPAKLTGCSFQYNDGISIEVYFEKFKYLERYNENSKWDFNKLKKEMISEIEIIRLKKE